jgi:hypothetical protein
MKALSAELSVLALALLIALSDFDLPATCSDEPELLGVAVGNILRAKAVPLRPIKAMAMKLVINRIFMENLLFIGLIRLRVPN